MTVFKSALNDILTARDIVKCIIRQARIKNILKIG